MTTSMYVPNMSYLLCHAYISFQTPFLKQNMNSPMNSPIKEDIKNLIQIPLKQSRLIINQQNIYYIPIE